MHCGSGDIFLVVEEQDSTCSRLNLPLLTWGNKSDIGHTRIKQKYYNSTDEKEKQKKRKAIAQYFALHANANARKDNL